MAEILSFAGKPSDSPADPTALLEVARAQLSWRPLFQESSTKEQEAEIQQQARGLAIAESEIGRSAARIGTALELLLDEMCGFLERWPNDSAAEVTTRAVITAAGLNPHPGRFCADYGPNHFQCTATELRIWKPVLDVIRERLETCEAVDTTASREEWEELQRRAA